MTRRMLTTMGSATAVAAVVGGCLLLGPTPQAKADITGSNGSSSGSISSSGGTTTITGTSSSGKGTVVFGPGIFCAMASSGTSVASFGKC
jgi:hypothetical protein